MGFDADYAIVGGGCAGLSLAVHLLERGPARVRTIVLEPRTQYQRDRTWCSFGTSSHPFERCVTHRWTRWRVHSNNGSVERGSAKYAYEHIPADAFYAESQERIRRSERTELRLGTGVDALRETSNGVTIETNAGSLRVKAAFDSRPLRAERHDKRQDVRLLQHFMGWFVHTDRAAFDPTVATLMDFRVDQQLGIHFVYVLPFDRDHALVEDTWFTENVLEDVVYEDALHAYFDRFHPNVGFTIASRERGVIPMTTETMAQRVSPRVYRIGVAGGMAKPSSGYAFRAIQRWSEEMCTRLVSAELPDPPVPRSERTKMLDRVFLSYLHHYPERAPELFRKLFLRAPVGALVRFLNEESSLADDVSVIAAVPRRALALETFRSRHLWMQR